MRKEMPIYPLDFDEYNALLDSREGLLDKYEPLGLFILESGSSFLGVQNMEGDAWTETFSDLQSCINWLRGIDPDPEMPAFFTDSLSELLYYIELSAENPGVPYMESLVHPFFGYDAKITITTHPVSGYAMLFVTSGYTQLRSHHAPPENMKKTIAAYFEKREGEKG